MVRMVKNKQAGWLLDRFKKSTITTRLLTLMLVLMFILAAGIVIWSDQQARSTVSSQQKDSLLRITEDLAERIDDQISTDLVRVKDLALNTITLAFFPQEGVPPIPSDLQVANYYYYLFLSQNTNFETLNLVDPTGKIVYSTEGLDSKQMNAVEPALGPGLLSQATRAPITSQVWFSAISHRPSLYYIAPVLLANSTQPLGYLLIRVNAGQFADLANDQNDRFGTGSFITVFDKNHVPIADGREGLTNNSDPSGYRYLYKGLSGNNYPAQIQPDPIFTPSNQAGVVDYHDPQTNGSYFLGYTVSSQTGWQIRQYIPADLITTPINNMTIASALGSLLVMIVAGFALYQALRRLIEPLNRLQAPLTSLAEGNLSEWQINTGGGREIEQIAGAFETMAYSLRELVIQVKESTAVVVTAASQVENASQQQLSNANQQGQYNWEVVEAMRELLQAATQIAEAGKQVASSAALTFNLADDLFNLDQAALGEVAQAREYLHTGLAKINQLNRMVEIIADHTESLKRTTGEIGTVLFLLKDVANEIHLLSLNAAIEAAGAGAFGDRFKVVASEVRGLARRSEQAVGKVQQMISDMQLVTGEVVASVADGTQQARQVSQDVNRIEQSMDQVYTIIHSLNAGSSQLVEVANDSASAATQIAGITAQQTNASNRVFELLQQVQSLIDELIASQAQGLAISSELNRRSTNLSQIVSQFKV